MAIQQLKEKLTSIAQMEHLGLNVYFLLKASEGYVLKRANIIERVKDDLITAYRDTLNGITSKEDLALINMSAADDRQHAIYTYDLEDRPVIFDYFDIIYDAQNLEQPDYFSFQHDSLANLEGYFVYLGDHENNLLFYRKQMPVNLFKRGKIYIIKDHDTQFDKIDEEFLRIDTKVDIISVDETVFINNLSILERHYEFRRIIETEANASLININTLEILDNIEVLRERISDTTFARKLSKISTHSPVFTLPPKQIMEFVTTHQGLGDKFKYNEDQSKIILDTRKSQNFFLKLINDDFLHSLLTKHNYSSSAKDRL